MLSWTPKFGGFTEGSTFNVRLVETALGKWEGAAFGSIPTKALYAPGAEELNVSTVLLLPETETAPAGWGVSTAAAAGEKNLSLIHI